MPRLSPRCYRHAAAVLVILAVPVLLSTAQTRDPDAREWIQLFNGRNLDGWSAKFARSELGENVRNTFRVEDGLLKVRYDQWPAFNGEFGHLFYQEPFSYYLIAAEYRFVGEQVGGAPAWAVRNNGLMLHSPDPKTMLRDQDFPIALEIQLLGGAGDGRPRTTANLCTPGAHVVYNGKLHTAHCTNSNSKTYDGDQWVRVEVLVHGDELVRHLVDGQTVLEYSRPQIGGGNVNPVDPAVKADGTPMLSPMPFGNSVCTRHPRSDGGWRFRSCRSHGASRVTGISAPSPASARPPSARRSSLRCRATAQGDREPDSSARHRRRVSRDQPRTTRPPRRGSTPARHAAPGVSRRSGPRPPLCYGVERSLVATDSAGRGFRGTRRRYPVTGARGKWSGSGCRFHGAIRVTGI